MIPFDILKFLKSSLYKDNLMTEARQLIDLFWCSFRTEAWLFNATFYFPCNLSDASSFLPSTNVIPYTNPELDTSFFCFLFMTRIIHPCQAHIPFLFFLTSLSLSSSFSQIVIINSFFQTYFCLLYKTCDVLCKLGQARYQFFGCSVECQNLIV